jgi:hypothetical protein
MDITKSPVSLESEHKPFIIISTKTMQQVKQNLKVLQSVYLACTHAHEADIITTICELIL